MEKLNFTPKVKKETWYSIVESIAKRLNDPTGKWLSKLKGISLNDILKMIRSAESMARDTGKPFGMCLNWIVNETLK